jgi:hypothetical protein
MAECTASPTGTHEPWMQPGNLELGIGPRPFDVSGLLKPPAFVCKHCQLVYVLRETMEMYVRSAERAKTGTVPTVGSRLRDALRASRKRKTDA